MRQILSILFCMAISIARLDAFIFEVQSIKKNDGKSQGPEWVIALGDLHDKNHPITQSQKEAIMQFLLRLPKGQVKILTEDLSSHGSFGRKTCGQFCINSRGGILGGLTQDCIAKGLPTENHEFRYCRVSALGPVLNNIKTDVFKHPSTSKIKMAALYNEVKKELDHIRSLNVGAVLKKEFHQNIKAAQTMISKLCITKDDEQSVASYLKGHVAKKSKGISLIADMLTFDSELIDCKLLHAIKTCKDKKYIVIIAGGSHVNRVCDLLMKDGYQKHFSIMAKDERIFDKQKCARRPMNKNGYCVAPRAVDLSCLKQCCDV